MEKKDTFTWTVGEVRNLHELKRGDCITSPPFEIKMLRGVKWCLRLQRPEFYFFDRDDSFECHLFVHNFDTSVYEKITATFKLELVDDFGIPLKLFIEKDDCYFFGRAYIAIKNFLDMNSLELYGDDDYFRYKKVKIRCQIIVRSSIKRKIENLTVIHNQWKINTPDYSSWSQKMKLPFCDATYTQIDVIISDSDEVIDIKIEKVDFQKPYTLKITALNNEDREIDFKGSKSLFKSTDESEEFETRIEKSELVDEAWFHQPYSFTLICTLSVNNDNLPSYPIGESLPSAKASSLTLQEDLKEMLLKEKHSDIKLRSHGNIIPAHKCLLSVRSPVFSTMFDQDMLETQTGIVDIPDVESGTLRAFLEYLYTDTIPVTDFEEVLKLLLVADKYQVNPLKDRCSTMLMSSLSLENVCEVVSVSEMVNQENLKSCAFDFIKKNKTSIISSPLWTEWMKKNKDLANEILVKLIVD